MDEATEMIRCLVGYLEAWDGPKFPPSELPRVIAEANEWLGKRPN